MRKIWFVQSRRNLRKFPFFTTSNSTAKDFVLLAFFLLCFYFAKKPSIYKICICRRPFTHFKKKNINFHSSIKKPSAIHTSQTQNFSKKWIMWINLLSKLCILVKVCLNYNIIIRHPGGKQVCVVGLFHLKKR